MPKLPPNLEFAISRLETIENFEKSPVYELLIKPLYHQLEGLKSAYDCKNLQEMATLKGLKQGLSFIPNMIETIKREGDVAKELNRKNQELDARIEKEITDPDYLDL
jgi:hypothetical protein